VGLTLAAATSSRVWGLRLLKREEEEAERGKGEARGRVMGLNEKPQKKAHTTMSREI